MKRKSVFRNVRLHVQRVLESPSEELGQAARFLAYQIRLWRLCGRTLVRDRLPTVAGDLTFKTILGIVPAFVLFLLFVNLFSQESDIGQRLQQQVYKALNISEITMRVDEEDVSLADKIDDLVSAVSRNVTAAAAVGFVFLIVLALSVLAGAEQAMNQIWRTGRGRRLWRRLGMFWVVLTLGPVAVALAAYMSSWMEEWLAGRTAPVSVVGQGIIGFLAAWFVLSLVYKILPNTPVTSRAALIGAMVASVIWMLVAKQAFGLYVRYAVGYRQIFGSLAVVPVFFIWIYISWI
ncbi:MAG: YhjD/YihY/BrkB family envelope integrity protein, partial [Phycisphaerae bacterium]|nr:YhjD/YihY/BrkB family envelope integrity protein [Phycisphaerae bacterium]